MRKNLSDSPTTAVSPSASPSTFVCDLSPKVVLRNTTSLTFRTTGGSSLSQASGADVVTVAAGGSVPMASVLAAAGFALHIDFVANAGFSFAGSVNVTVSLGNAVPTASGSAILVDVSIANVHIGELPASSTTRLVVSVDAVVSPPVGTPCPPGNVTFIFGCFLAPLRPSTALKSAVEATYRASTAISSMLGNPVTAMSNTGMVSILTLEECVFSDIDPLDAAVSPVPLSVGDEVGQYYRGCVVIAVAVVGGYFSLAPLISAVIAKLIPSRTPGDILGLLRYPSSVMIFVGMFHQGMVSSSVSLLRLADSPLDMLLGSCGLVAAACLTVFMLLAGTRWRQCHVVDRSDDETHSSMKVVQLFLDLALWKQHWVDDVRDDGTPSGYKRRYLFILDDMAVGYWAAVELASGLTQGAILGVRKNDLQACQIQRLVLAVHCFLMVATLLIVRPCGSVFGNLFLIASKFGSFVVSLLIVIHTVSGSEAAYQQSEVATAGFAFVSSVQTAIQLLLLLVLSRKTLLMLFRSLLRRLWASVPNNGDSAFCQLRGDPQMNVAGHVHLQEMMLGDLVGDDYCDAELAIDTAEEQETQTIYIAEEAANPSAGMEEVPQPPPDPKAVRKQARQEKRRQSIVKFLREGYSGFEGKKAGKKGCAERGHFRQSPSQDRDSLLPLL